MFPLEESQPHITQPCGSETVILGQLLGGQGFLALSFFFPFSTKYRFPITRSGVLLGEGWCALDIPHWEQMDV